MTDAGLTINAISDEYHDDVDRQSILSVIMEVIADRFYCLGLRDIILKKTTTTKKKTQNFSPDWNSWHAIKLWEHRSLLKELSLKNNCYRTIHRIRSRICEMFTRDEMSEFWKYLCVAEKLYSQSAIYICVEIKILILVCQCLSPK